MLPYDAIRRYLHKIYIKFVMQFSKYLTNIKCKSLTLIEFTN